MSPPNSKARSLVWIICAAALLALVVPAVAQKAAPPGKATASNVAPGSALVWRSWSDAVFADAKRDHKFVLLDLEAVWCHWCHVMDEITYKDPAVRQLLQSKYILVKVDQDSRPDLSNRYEDYGWPATIVFNADHGEIVKRQGYLPPKPMASMLQAIIDDPSPGPSVEPEEAISLSTTSEFSPAVTASLRKNFDAQYDAANAGWGFSHKYLDVDSVEYALLAGRHGNKEAGQRAQATLNAELKILDPVWGGAYQYSAGGTWDEPHFEKLISIQAQQMRAYSMGYAQTKDAAYLKAARGIHTYVENFLTDPSGAFYVSQDADLIEGEHSADYFALDDKARRAKGIPRVDKHLYARENGWMISALCSLYSAAGDSSALAQARKAAVWVGAHRSIAGGGFHHAEHDVAGPFLGDTLAMGQAYLDLYSVTAEPIWLTKAEAARKFIDANFAAPAGSAGYLTSKTPTDKSYQPHAERDENAQFVRFTNLLDQYTGEAGDRKAAEAGMRYLAAREIALRPLAGGVLLTEAEYSAPPIHITVVGGKKDAAAAALFATALASPSTYKRTEWLDLAQPAAVRNDVQYPHLDRAAAFLCTATTCSSPVFESSALTARIDKALATAAFPQ